MAAEAWTSTFCLAKRVDSSAMSASMMLSMSGFQIRLILYEQFIGHVEARQLGAILGSDVRQTLYDVGELADRHEHNAASENPSEV